MSASLAATKQSKQASESSCLCFWILIKDVGATTSSLKLEINSHPFHFNRCINFMYRNYKIFNFLYFQNKSIVIYANYISTNIKIN